LGQDANGIIGLAPVLKSQFKPVFYSYFDQGFIDSLQFSLLFGKNGGKIYFGDYDDKVIIDSDEGLTWLDVIKPESYTIKLKDYKIGGIVMPSGPMLAKIDSGVSTTYLTKRQYRVIEQTISGL
jgi:hypothetical protein